MLILNIFKAKCSSNNDPTYWKKCQSWYIAHSKIKTKLMLVMLEVKCYLCLTVILLDRRWTDSSFLLENKYIYVGIIKVIECYQFVTNLKSFVFYFVPNAECINMIYCSSFFSQYYVSTSLYHTISKCFVFLLSYYS